MKVATVVAGEVEQAAIVVGDQVILLKDINQIEQANWETRVWELIQTNQLNDLTQWFNQIGIHKLKDYPMRGRSEFTYSALYRAPKLIFGIGMNYMQKAEDLNSFPPNQEPVSFLKPNSSLIGPEEEIKLPASSKNVTAEAELGIIIGKTCRNVEVEKIPSYVAGFTNTLDMTAQDVHARNPRFLQLSKIHDTFFSFGPHLITLDEISNLSELMVHTVLNEEVIYSNKVQNMFYHPWFIVSFFSKIVTLSPGDIIMTGTPGSVSIQPMDIAICQIGNWAPLINPVGM